MLWMLALTLAPVQPAAHPRWMVGDWCYPEGKPLHFGPAVAVDPDETSSFAASGRYTEVGESGRWRIQGSRLILRRERAESWTLSKGETVKITQVIVFARHGRDAMSWRGGRNGWVLRC